jgi:ABC-type Fe3+ transport system substrate-binding protein
MRRHAWVAACDDQFRSNGILNTRVLAVCASLLLFAASCGGAAPSPSPSSSGALAQGSAAPVPSNDPQLQALAVAARAEGALTIAVPPGPQYQPAIRDAFGKAFPGIELNMVNLIGGEFRVRVAKERAAGQFAWDACICGPGADTYQLAADGVFDPIRDELVLPEVMDDAKWLGGLKGRFSDVGTKFVFDFGASNSQSVFVNRDLVPASALSRFDDLWKPDFKGKIVWQDPRGPGSGVNQATIVLHVKGEQSLRDLWSSQQIQLSSDDRQMADFLARGSRPIGVGLVANRGVDLLKQQGVGLNVQSLPSLVATAVPGPHSIVAINRPPHPNARKLFINWLLTPEGQATILKPVKYNSARLDVPIFDPQSEIPKGVDVINPQTEAFAPERIKAGQIATELFK